MSIWQWHWPWECRWHVSSQRLMLPLQRHWSKSCKTSGQPASFKLSLLLLLISCHAVLLCIAVRAGLLDLCFWHHTVCSAHGIAGTAVACRDDGFAAGR